MPFESTTSLPSRATEQALVFWCWCVICETNVTEQATEQAFCVGALVTGTEQSEKQRGVRGHSAFHFRKCKLRQAIRHKHQKQEPKAREAVFLRVFGVCPMLVAAPSLELPKWVLPLTMRMGPTWRQLVLQLGLRVGGVSFSPASCLCFVCSLFLFFFGGRASLVA